MSILTITESNIFMDAYWSGEFKVIAWDPALSASETDGHAAISLKVPYGNEHHSYDFTWMERDTIFTVSAENVIKFYKKKYFLNYQDDDGYWLVNLMELKDNMLTFYCIVPPEGEEELEKLTAIQEVRNECGELVKIVLYPTRKGLKKLITEEYLLSLKTYYKISEK